MSVDTKQLTFQRGRHHLISNITLINVLAFCNQYKCFGFFNIKSLTFSLCLSISKSFHNLPTVGSKCYLAFRKLLLGSRFASTKIRRLQNTNNSCQCFLNLKRFWIFSYSKLQKTCQHFDPVPPYTCTYFKPVILFWQKHDLLK